MTEETQEKLVDRNFNGNYETRGAPHPQEEIDDHNDVFISYMENKLEEKLGESLSRVLDKSLQQWTTKMNGVNAIETNFPKKIFKRSRDQYEYDAVCDTGTLLQKAIQEDSKEKVAEVQERLRLRAFILRVAEEEGWNIAVKIPKPTPEGDEFRNLLVEARKQAKQKEGYFASYNLKTWQTKGRKFWSWGSRANYYTPYPPPHSYTQHTPSPQTYQNQTAVCASRSAEREKQGARSNEQYRTQQRSHWKDSRTSGDKIMDGKNKPTTRSSLLVEKQDTSIPKKRIESCREQSPEALQNDNGPGRLAASEKYWALYEKFCKRFGLDVENPQENGKEDLEKSLAVTQVLRAIKKE
ncbi:2487_t:CDS:2, partial [Scutellospora calospora]